jgi:beta-glucosidase
LIWDLALHGAKGIYNKSGVVFMRGLKFGAALMCFFLLEPFVLSSDERSEWIDYNKNGKLDPYENPELPAEERAKDLVSRMTLEEKIDMLHGVTGMGATGYIAPNERLGIPALMMEDGPVGVRRDKATGFPAPIGMAATWDPELIEIVGKDIGEEVRAKGRDVLLAPCVNILRVPFGGRSFEAFGEDPYLVSRMAVSYIKGVQSNGIIATPKHYAANNQEEGRMTVSADVDERALREIYLPAFEASVKEGKALSVMAAYNRLNGKYCTENEDLLRILEDEWGFKGYVVSDWGATHSTVEAATGGLDVEMPDDKHFGHSLLEAVKAGFVDEGEINDKVSSVLYSMFSAGILDREREQRDIDIEGHGKHALQAAAEGMVLLKNEGNILPLSEEDSVAIIGPEGVEPRYYGGGSAQVDPFYTISPSDALKAVFREVNHAKGIATPTVIGSSLLSGNESGLTGEYFNNVNLSGDPVMKRIDKQVYFDWKDGSPAPEINADKFSVRWSGDLKVPESGAYTIAFTSDDGIRVWIDGKLLIDAWKDQGSTTYKVSTTLSEGLHDIKIEYYENSGGAVAKFLWNTPRERENALQEALDSAKRSSAAIVFVSDEQTEGSDHEAMLSEDQNELIERIAEANRKTIVVLNTGGPVLIGGWTEKVPAILEAWYGGEEMGNALADIIAGKVNPSGKLPVTFPKDKESIPAFYYSRYTEAGYPGVADHVGYSEGIFVGYRHYDTRGIEPLFPFGYGLSYTTFEYNNIEAPRIVRLGGNMTVSITVKNTGNVAGAEVVQLYIRDEKASLERPSKELKGFQKIYLEPNESRKLSFEINVRDLAFYDPARDSWVAEPGRFEVLIGSSSEDIRASASLLALSSGQKRI